MVSEEKQTKELNSLRNIPDSFKKLVIVNGTKKIWRNEEGDEKTFDIFCEKELHKKYQMIYLMISKEEK